MPATLVRPADAAQVAAVVAWCYAHDVAIVPVGGRSGLAGGAAVLDAGARRRAVARAAAHRALVRARAVADGGRGGRDDGDDRPPRARERPAFAPDPGAPEQSQLGGTIATNAGGPHAFKYGVTGDWVTGIEAVLAPGELVRVGGPVRKDVAGYDLRALLIGSEGTLGIVTAAWLRFVPAPEARWRSSPPTRTPRRAARRSCACWRSGIVPAALEFFDEARCAPRGRRSRSRARGAAGFSSIAEADGSAAEAARVRDELREALAPGGVAVVARLRSARASGAGARASRSP